jgi:hypothetical protein
MLMQTETKFRCTVLDSGTIDGHAVSNHRAFYLKRENKPYLILEAGKSLARAIAGAAVTEKDRWPTKTNQPI